MRLRTRSERPSYANDGIDLELDEELAKVLNEEDNEAAGNGGKTSKGKGKQGRRRKATQESSDEEFAEEDQQLSEESAVSEGVPEDEDDEIVSDPEPADEERPRGKAKAQASAPRKYKRTHREAFEGPIAAWEDSVSGPRAEDIIDLDEIDGLMTHESIQCRLEDWHVLSEEDGKTYLPDRQTAISVRIGRDPTPVDLETLQSIALDGRVPNKRGFVINTGGSIWALDWCPKVKGQEEKMKRQYLAVAGYQGTMEENHIVGATGVGKNAIQIWSVPTSEGNEVPRLELCICHDFGWVWNMKWCPYGAYEVPGKSDSSPSTIAKLGILAVAFGDGIVRLYTVPHPLNLSQTIEEQYGDGGMEVDAPSDTLFVSCPKSLVELGKPKPCQWTLCWAGVNRLLTGDVYGRVFLWDIERASRNNDDHPQPTFMVQAHEGCVRSIAVNCLRDPVYFTTAGFDGKVVVFDMRDPWTPMIVSRQRTLQHTVAWPTRADKIAAMTQDESIKKIFLTPGPMCKASITLVSMDGVTWMLASAQRHCYVAGVTNTGLLRMVNFYRDRNKYWLPVSVTLYKLEYNRSTSTFRYVDAIPLNPEPKATSSAFHTLLSKQEVSLQTVAWNPNADTASWIASGGVAGLCRIEETLQE
ncbi:hypothetical protein BZG36_00033 [Bifiguratus adelaidae]|uniref:Uncharacterized protein n=1 Tax=Bifiguratus adelaidae TaxID=1938954 RepID=A0A261Y8P7_9FUNG|nr:hypothetical protein BZG36_00033 [Bifiguratus adelaidae]